MNGDERILFVDDEPNVLSAFVREFEDEIEVFTATSAAEGLCIIAEEGPFDVVVSDLRMPEVDGVSFLSQVKEFEPDTQRVMLTGNADLDSAIDAVNDGRIFRFLTKPCEMEVLRATLSAAAGQYRLVIAEHEILNETLNQSIRTLAETLALANPVAFSRTNRIRGYVDHIIDKLGIVERWRFDIAAMLSQVGCVSLPPDLLDKVYSGESLDEAERAMYLAHPDVAYNLLHEIPRMGEIARIVRSQMSPESPEHAEKDLLEWPAVELGSSILSVALEYDLMRRSGRSREASIHAMLRKSPGFAPEIVAVLTDVPDIQQGYRMAWLSIGELDTTMILDKDVLMTDGRLLVAGGTPMGYALIERLRNYSHNGMIADEVHVRIPLAA